MAKYESIKKAFAQLGQEQAGSLFLAKVVEVSLSEGLCDVQPLENEDLRLFDVRLSPFEESDYVAVPALESWVIVARLSQSQGYFVLKASKLEQLVFFEGEKGKLVEIELLKSRLNAIEQAFNALLNHYKTHNHTHPQGNTIALVPPNTQATLGLTQEGDLSNSKIKQ